MTGIYCFTNPINNKRYIGQSKNIEQRYLAHKARYLNLLYDNHFYRALRKYGFDTFIFSVLEETSNLDEAEIKWIEYYDSFNNGYNSTSGGEIFIQISRESVLKHSGENHKFSAFTNDEVYEIREKKIKGIPFNEVYSEYKNRITEKGFTKIWRGDRYTDTHMDIYEVLPTKRKPMTPNNIVLAIRKDFMNGLSKKQIIDKYSMERRTIERILKLETRVQKELIPDGFIKLGDIS